MTGDKTDNLAKELLDQLEQHDRDHQQRMKGIVRRHNTIRAVLIMSFVLLVLSPVVSFFIQDK